MSGAVYLDSSALVKLAVLEPESAALRRYLLPRSPLVSSALARTEVSRALLPYGRSALERGLQVLRGIELIRLSDRLLAAAGRMLPASVRSLDAIHLATAAALGEDLSQLCTYDVRIAGAGAAAGMTVVAPE